MRVKVRCCSLTKPAADGSIIPEHVVRQYLASEDYKLSVEGHLTMGFLTHRGRSLELSPQDIGGAAIKKVVGRDDTGLIVNQSLPAFTHYVEEFFIESDKEDGDLWLMAWVKIFDEDGFDYITVQNIKRLKALIREKVALTCSLVVLAYWNGSNSGTDIAERIKSIKSLDWTVNPSFGPKARIIEVIDEVKSDSESEKTFSEILDDPMYIKSQPKREGEVKVKTFSNLSEFGITNDTPKSSKINGKFTLFKIKEFSTVSTSLIIDEEVPITVEEPVQKDFSVVALRDRLREAKYSPRQRFRVLILSYKQLLKQQGGVEKIDPETLRILKSLFTTDILDIMKTITPDIMKGKNPGTLLGASSLGKGVRQTVQKLFLPYKMAMTEVTKTGAISKARYQKIQEAYSDFTNAMIDEIFAPKVKIGSKQAIEEEQLPEEEIQENNK